MKYRVIQKKDKFYPQLKKYFFTFWECFSDDYDPKVASFNSLAAANEAITEFIQDQKITIFPYEGNKP